MEPGWTGGRDCQPRGLVEGGWRERDVPVRVPSTRVTGLGPVHRTRWPRGAGHRSCPPGTWAGAPPWNTPSGLLGHGHWVAVSSSWHSASQDSQRVTLQVLGDGDRSGLQRLPRPQGSPRGSIPHLLPLQRGPAAPGILENTAVPGWALGGWEEGLQGGARGAEQSLSQRAGPTSVSFPLWGSPTGESGQPHGGRSWRAEQDGAGTAGRSLLLVVVAGAGGPTAHLAPELLDQLWVLLLYLLRKLLARLDEAGQIIL